MGEMLEEAVRDALRAVRDPASGRDIVAAGMVEGLTVRSGMVQFALQVPRERARASEPLRAAAEKAAAAVPGVLSATVVLTAHRAEPPKAAPQPGGPGAAPGGRAAPGQGDHAPRASDHAPRASDHAPRASDHAPRASGAMLLPEVGAIIAVASGKGGVGKSTTAVNLALALASQGLGSACSTPTSTAPPSPSCSAPGAAAAEGADPHPPADGELRHQGHVHGLPRRGGDGDDLARPDGDGRR
jgi:ATP-binding protein involved in chromosome partitioning